MYASIEFAAHLARLNRKVTVALAFGFHPVGSHSRIEQCAASHIAITPG